jgi:hypothetical protein
VTKVTWHYYTTLTSAYVGGVNLQRTRLGQGNYENMAVVSPYPETSGYSSDTDDTINYATVDNSQYAYWVFLELHSSGSGADEQTWDCGVVIEYTYQLYLPLTLRQYP